MNAVVSDAQTKSAAAEPVGMAGRRGQARVIAVPVLASILAAAAVVLAGVGAVRLGHGDGWVAAAAVVAWAVGAVIVAARRIAPVAFIIAAIAAAGGAALLASDAPTASSTAGAVRSVAVALVVGLLFVLAFALPDGVVGRHRVPALVGLAAITAATAALLVAAAPRISHPALLLGSLLLGAVAAPSVLSRCRAANVADRARMQWTGLAALLVAAASIVAVALSQLTGWPEHVPTVAAAASTAIPAAIVVATFDRTLAAAPRLLVHAITAAGMTVLATGVYFVLVVGVDGTPASGERAIVGLSIAATVLIAVLALPLRRRLEAFANQRVYGERQRPDVALQTMATRMSRAVPMDELLLQLAETLRKSMALRSAEIWTGADGVLDLAVSVPDRAAPRITLSAEESTVAARAPVTGLAWLAVWVPALAAARTGFVRVAPVAHLGELLGLIVVGRPADTGEFDEEQDRVLTDIARQLGLALHNVRLDTALQASLDELQLRNAELVASRARIVSTADESRRQIERNLHDGAQQHLVAMAVKLGLARQLLAADPGKATELMEELRSDVQATVTELRELAHGIYPPLLRSRGLPEALTAAAGRSALPTTVVAPGLPRFDADVEAAVYFCCLEAIQNAGKHAGGQATITVEVRQVGAELEFTVADDGAGFDASTAAGGQGFVNMADRLGAIGGELNVTSEPGRGTSVRGRLAAPPA